MIGTEPLAGGSMALMPDREVTRMPEHKTPNQIADELDQLADAISLLSIRARLRILAQELRTPGPDWPETSRASHSS